MFITAQFIKEFSAKIIPGKDYDLAELKKLLGEVFKEHKKLQAEKRKTKEKESWKQHEKKFKEEEEEYYIALEKEISKQCKILGLLDDASFEQIKKKYRKLVLLYHPDKLTKEPDDENKEAKIQYFKDISEAYTYLSNILS